MILPLESHEHKRDGLIQKDPLATRYTKDLGVGRYRVPPEWMLAEQ